MKAMKLTLLSGLALVLAAGCSPYRSRPQMNYFHGETPPAGFIKILRATEAEVEFQITVVMPADHMYHLLLDGNEPLAEGWFPTGRMASSQGYRVTLKLREGLRLETGKSYRLCIGVQNPEDVQMTTSNYRCLVDYPFVFQVK